VLQIGGQSVYAYSIPCSNTPTFELEAKFAPYNLSTDYQEIIRGSGVTAALTSFEHTDGNVYVRAGECVVYTYTDNTPSQPFQAISSTWPIMEPTGGIRVELPCVDSPPPPSPPPSPPACFCTNTCTGLRDDGGDWSGGAGSSDGSGRVRQVAYGGFCGTQGAGMCTSTTTFSHNGVCEDGAAGSVPAATYYLLCEFYNGNGVDVNCTQNWLPCGFGSDCSDCTGHGNPERCEGMQTPAAASATFTPPSRVRFSPQSGSVGPGQTLHAVVNIDQTVLGTGPFGYLNVALASSSADLTITPAVVTWTDQDTTSMGRAFTITGGPTVSQAANTQTITLTTNAEYYAGYTPTFTLAAAVPSPPPPAIPPVATGCSATNAFQFRNTIEECLAYYTLHDFDTRGAFSYPDGNLTAGSYPGGICYFDTQLATMFFRAYTHIQQCTTYACYCSVSSPPPPPPGSCGTDYCGCANPDGNGGYAICPGEANCHGPPNRCMTSWNSVCEEDATVSNGRCSPARYQAYCVDLGATVWCVDGQARDRTQAACDDECVLTTPPPSPSMPPGHPGPPLAP